MLIFPLFLLSCTSFSCSSSFSLSLFPLTLLHCSLCNDIFQFLEILRRRLTPFLLLCPNSPSPKLYFYFVNLFFASNIMFTFLSNFTIPVNCQNHRSIVGHKNAFILTGPGAPALSLDGDRGTAAFKPNLTKWVIEALSPRQPSTATSCSHEEQASMSYFMQKRQIEEPVLSFAEIMV